MWVNSAAENMGAILARNLADVDEEMAARGLTRVAIKTPCTSAALLISDALRTSIRTKPPDLGLATVLRTRASTRIAGLAVINKRALPCLLDILPWSERQKPHRLQPYEREYSK
jgi:hypothetical protein